MIKGNFKPSSWICVRHSPIIGRLDKFTADLSYFRPYFVPLMIYQTAFGSVDCLCLYLSPHDFITNVRCVAILSSFELEMWSDLHLPGGCQFFAVTRSNCWSSFWRTRTFDRSTCSDRSTKTNNIESLANSSSPALRFAYTQSDNYAFYSFKIFYSFYLCFVSCIALPAAACILVLMKINIIFFDITFLTVIL